MARPSKLDKLTDEQLGQIETFIRAGATVEVAAASVGVTKQTLYNWLKRTEPRARELQERIERAKAQSETVFLARIATAAGRGSWGAAAWILERRFPERYLRRTELTLPVEPSPSSDDREDALAEVIELAKRRERRKR